MIICFYNVLIGRGGFKMKKIISILISIILILSISPTKLTNAETFENNISDKDEITNTEYSRKLN